MISFSNRLDKAETERLAILLEEMGEAQQMIGKVLRHGYESTHPNGGPTNRRALERELGDVLVAIKMMCRSGDLNEQFIEENEKQKEKTGKKWLHHQ
jgi:NTP pyrophosphatase (non-canonical NTP hydrolase)